MCGIYLTITQRHDDHLHDTAADVTSDLLPQLLLLQPPEWLLRRGPDACATNEIIFYSNNDILHSDERSDSCTSSTAVTKSTTTTTKVTLYASVLQMRDTFMAQPVDLSCFIATTASKNSSNDCDVDVSYQSTGTTTQTSNHNHHHHQFEKNKNGPYVAWNGEIYEYYNIRTNCVESDIYQSNRSDTELISQLLYDQVDFCPQQSSTSKGHSNSNNHSILPQQQLIQIQQQIAAVMGQLTNAEYAFCIVTSTCIYYGRDTFGRRSLLATTTTGTTTSRTTDTGSGQNSNDDNKISSPTTTTASTTSEPNSCIRWQLASVVTGTTADDDPTLWHEVTPGLVHAYPIRQHLFVSDTDSLPMITEYDIQPIRIITTTTQTKLCPMVVPHQPLPMVDTNEFPPIASNCHARGHDGTVIQQEFYCQQLYSTLLDAVRRRCGRTSAAQNINDKNHPNNRQRTTTTTNSHEFSSIATAVLFSGGLDSTVIAALALEAGVSELTLLTVSFIDQNSMNDTTTTGTHTTTTTSTTAADAIAAEQSYDELCRLYPNATIHLIHRIVDWEAVQKIEKRIRTLAFPKTATVMDVNIATALWFAASADIDNANIAGSCRDQSTSSSRDAQTDTATCNLRRRTQPRILLSGLGSDELMGGYGRHRSAYNRGGYNELKNELDLDINRLWERNLGRDDRILSDTSKEVRFPFLDPNVIQLIRDIPLEYVVDYTLDVGVGDKRILRLVANRMGLSTASTAIKRAIQFGSRISHVSDKRRYGSRRKANARSKTLPK